MITPFHHIYVIFGITVFPANTYNGLTESLVISSSNTSSLVSEIAGLLLCSFFLEFTMGQTVSHPLFSGFWTVRVLLTRLRKFYHDVNDEADGNYRHSDEFQGDTNMKNSKITVSAVLRIVLALAAIGFIITSMITDRTTPFLAIGLSLLAISNIINWSSKDFRKRLRGNCNGSAEDRNVS